LKMPVPLASSRRANSIFLGPHTGSPEAVIADKSAAWTRTVESSTARWQHPHLLGARTSQRRRRAGCANRRSCPHGIRRNGSAATTVQGAEDLTCSHQRSGRHVADTSLELMRVGAAGPAFTLAPFAL